MVRYLQTLVLLGSSVLVRIGGTYLQSYHQNMGRKTWCTWTCTDACMFQKNKKKIVLQSEEMYSVLVANTLVNPSSAYLR